MKIVIAIIIALCLCSCTSIYYDGTVEFSKHKIIENPDYVRGYQINRLTPDILTTRETKMPTDLKKKIKEILDHAMRFQISAEETTEKIMAISPVCVHMRNCTIFVKEGS